MNCMRFLVIPGIVLLILVACGPAQKPAAYPLAESGQYLVGARTVKFVDESRGSRKVSVTIWYPTKGAANVTSTAVIPDAEPDRSAAPYPLILSSTKMANTLALNVVSHGFAWVSVDGIDTYFAFYEGAIEQPLDILFALNQVATHPPEGLEGLIDSQNVGSIGYSFDGFNSLAMSGARIDPEYYLAQCPTPDGTTEDILGELSAFSCIPARQWDEFTAHVGESITSSQDGLWQPLTDPRIRAVMPMAGEGWWLFGERGLAAVDRPIMIIVATQDELYKENALIFEHLGTADKRLISFLGQTHGGMLNSPLKEQMAHFAVAFFGYYLQGREDYAAYFSEEFVKQHDDLFWGVYEGD